MATTHPESLAEGDSERDGLVETERATRQPAPESPAREERHDEKRPGLAPPHLEERHEALRRAELPLKPLYKCDDCIEQTAFRRPLLFIKVHERWLAERSPSQGGDDPDQSTRELGLVDDLDAHREPGESARDRGG